MSEAHSLYVKIKIRKNRLEQFFSEQPSNFSVDSQWQKWWDGREMYAKNSLEDIPFYRMESNQAIVNIFLNDPGLGAIEYYDEAEGTWSFLVLCFSENYTEILPMLSLLKSITSYLDTEEIGVAIIYDFLWGDDSVMAYLEYQGNKVEFKEYNNVSQIRAEVLLEANAELEALSKKLQERYSD